MGEIRGRCPCHETEITTMGCQGLLTSEDGNAIFGFFNIESVGCTIKERDFVYSDRTNDTFILQS